MWSDNVNGVYYIISSNCRCVNCVGVVEMVEGVIADIQCCGEEHSCDLISTFTGKGLMSVQNRVKLLNCSLQTIRGDS